MNEKAKNMQQKVLIVGAPNVGKSTLFNALIKKRKAIVFKEPGVTRDMIHGEFSDGSMRFTVVDTGGLIPGDRDAISEAVQNQVLRAVASASLVIFVVDGRMGVTQLDEKISLFLLRSGTRVILCVNKLDLPQLEDLSLPFYSLGHGDPVCISAENRRGIESLVARVALEIGSSSAAESFMKVQGGEIRIVIVGRQNVGKSSLLNALIGDERMIVSELPGTTIDSVDSLLKCNGRKYIIVDTAGIRKKKRAQDDIEKIAVVKARQNIKMCDIVLLLLDCGTGVTTQDAAIAGYALHQWKPLLVLFNKWDLIEDKEQAIRHYEHVLARKMGFLKGTPVLFISALSKKGIHKILPAVDALFKKYVKKIPTTDLNRFISKKVKMHPLFSSLSSDAKLFYMVQAGSRPQRFIAFVKNAKTITAHKKRFLENILREGFDLDAVPIQIEFRERRESLKRISK